MKIKDKMIPSSVILRSHVNQYTLMGLMIALGSIFIASCIVAYQLTGYLSLGGFIDAQKSNPAIWILDLTPFMFGYWGQAFCTGVVRNAQLILSDKMEEFLKISGNLELKLKYESNHDSVTKLPNSRKFSELIKNAVSQLGNQGQLAVILVKINDFETINFNFGTFNANKILKLFADKLSSILVESYMLQASLGLSSIACMQGEEFAFLLPRLKDNFNPEDLLAILHQSMITPFMIDGIKINILTTSGVALYPVHGVKEDELLNHANIALSYAKKQELPYTVYDSGMEDDFTQSRNMMSELKRSIDNNELDIFFQPVVELSTGIIVGAESLVRFEHPKLGLLSADKFIPLIEGTELIKNLSAFMLTGVIRQLAAWHKDGYPIFVSVNLSVQDAIDRELPQFINKLLIEHGLAPEFLKLEFNERACLADQEVTKEVFEEFSKIGIKLSIDDFCSGYTSFIYLLNFPINDIKIEKSHVLNMTKDAKKDKIVEGIIKLTEILKLDTVAEGVADEATLKRLVQLGCSYGQGFHFSPAVDAVEFKNLLNKHIRTVDDLPVEAKAG